MKFILIADDKKLPVVFFSEWKVALFVLVLSLVLLLLFPYYLLKKTLTYYHEPSAAMLGYLQSFRSIHPQDKQLWLAIIEQEIGLGLLKKAEADLAVYQTMESNPLEMLTQSHWIAYLFLRYRTHQAKINNPQRIVYLGQLRRMATRLSDMPFSPQQLKILAQDNLSLAQASNALKIYNNLFDKQALKTGEELAQGGSIAMQNNAQAQSAKFYWAAFNQAISISDKRDYAMKTLQALWAGNLLDKALARAAQLPNAVLDNRQLLLYLSHLAIAANQPNAAQDYALKAVRLSSKYQSKDVFDEEAYQLAYQTALYNANISIAHTLAQIAVYRRPRSLVWHEKLAQSADWIGDYNQAMGEWLYVTKHTHNVHTLQNAITTAERLGYDQVLATLLERYLSHYPKDSHALFTLAQTENKLFQPNKALQTLQKLQTLHPSRDADELTAIIYQDMGNWDKALSTWEKLNRNEPDMRSVMAQTDIYYSQGKFKQALDSLTIGIPLAKQQDKPFWEKLAELAWQTNNRKLAVLGYSHDLNDYSHLVRLTQLERVPHPEQALFYSLLGWDHFSRMLFFLNSLYLSEQLKKWPVIERLLGNLSQRQLATVEKTLEFWQAQINFYAACGEKKQQRVVLIQAVQLHPEFLALKSALLWFLMTEGESQLVIPLMEDWKDSMHNPLLWHAFAEGYDVLNQFHKAIAMYQTHLFETFHEDQVLIDYAAVLEKAQIYQQANKLRKFVWDRALVRLNQMDIPDKETMETLSQLSPLYVSGTEQISLLNALLNKGFQSNTDQSMNIALNWMIERGDIDLISFFKTYYLHNGLPYKPALILALAKNDLPALQAFLEKPEQPFLRSERINAAVRLENTPLAEEIAFKELADKLDRPATSEIYREFTYYALQDSNFGRIGQEYEQFINLIGPRTYFEGKLKLTNKLKLRPYIKRWAVRTNDPTIMTNVPTQDLQAGIKLEEKIHRGMITYNLGYRDALSGFVPLDIDLIYRLASRWTTNINVGFNQEVFQTAYLRIGGVQDHINLTLFYRPAKYDFLQMGVQGLNYYSQNRNYLANGFNLHGLYEHKFWLNYPDYTVGIFADAYEFNRNGHDVGDIATLFPKLTPSQQANPSLVERIQSANNQQVIPESYAQGGFIFSFGSAILDYTHEWRPFLWASVFGNTLVGLANNVKIGLNGSVFGRDSLYFYAEYGTAQAVANSTIFKVGARYSIYL